MANTYQISDNRWAACGSFQIKFIIELKINNNFFGDKQSIGRSVLYLMMINPFTENIYFQRSCLSFVLCLFRLLIEQMAGNDNLKCRDFSFWLWSECWIVGARIVLSLIRDDDDDDGERHISPIRSQTHPIDKLTALQPTKSNRKSSQTIVTHVRLFIFHFFALFYTYTHTVRFVFVSFIYISIVLSSQWQQQPEKKMVLSECTLWKWNANQWWVTQRRENESVARRPTYLRIHSTEGNMWKRKNRKDLLNDFANGGEKWILYEFIVGVIRPSCCIPAVENKTAPASLELH